VIETISEGEWVMMAKLRTPGPELPELQHDLLLGGVRWLGRGFGLTGFGHKGLSKDKQPSVVSRRLL